MLEGKKSFISFCVHDSMIIDLADEDKHLLPKVVEAFSNTDLGMFKANVSVGTNFGAMQGIR